MTFFNKLLFTYLIAEHLLRIRFNGDSIEKFNVEYYSRLWVDNHYYTDQVTRRKSTAKLLTDDNEEDEDEEEGEEEKVTRSNLY